MKTLFCTITLTQASLSSCSTNLQCLTGVQEVFLDGTFKCCPKFFAQLYTLHGYKSGNYVPLLYMLLPGKAKNVYRQAFEIIVEKCSDIGINFSPSVFHIVVPSGEKRTNNGPEAFHRHFNATIKTPHPNIGQFLDFILKLQTTTYIKIRCIDQPAVIRREHREKSEHAVATYSKFQSGDIELRQYMAVMGHSFQAVTNL